MTRSSNERVSNTRKVVKRDVMFARKDIIVRTIVQTTPWPRDSEHIGRPYHASAFGGRGGSVSAYFYNLPPGTAAGAKVAATVTVMKRVFADGGSDIYADFEVVETETPPKHEFVVHQAPEQFKVSDNTVAHFKASKGEGVIEIRKRKLREKKD